jgi:hypothetical protein
MSSSEGIQAGMPVFGSDEQLVGTVTKVHGEYAIGMIEIDCGGEACRVPLTGIAQVAADKIYLPNPAGQYRTQPHAREARAALPDSAEAVPDAPTVDPRENTTLYEEPH